MRWLGWIVGVALGLCLLVVAGAAGFLWLGLPKTSGEIRLAGPSAPITVTRDRRGIPYIRAETDADAAFALGFVHAQDRFGQMELMRRLVTGRLAEAVGAAALDSDKFMRTLGLGRLAESAVAVLSPESQAVLNAYAYGVNAALAEQAAPPPEFLAMGPKPEPWRPADSLLWARLMALQLTWNWRDELSRSRLASRLTPDQLRDLYDRTGDGPHVPLAQLDPDFVGRLLAAIPDEARPRTASNVWVLSGARTETGKPLLANDPHLSLTLPNLWYLARIETPMGIRVGATAPGVPFTILGHNGKIAWGLTTTQADTADLFVLHPSADGGYLTPDGPKAYVVRTETIRVRNSAPVDLTVRESVHGPVISDVIARMAADGTAIALASTALVAEDRTPEALARLLKAGSVAEAQAALTDFQAPLQNIGVADTAGHIGLFVSGRIPDRGGDGWMPSMATDRDRIWKGWRAPDPDLAVIDPPSGRIVNANNAPVVDPLARGYGLDFDSPYRARRIAERLDQLPKATVKDMVDLQADTLSVMARDVLPTLLRLTPRTDATAAALDRLAAWDGDMRRDRGEPLVFTAWWRVLLRSIYADELGDAWGEILPRPGVVLRTLNQRIEWCDDKGTPAAETCAEQLSSSLALALSDLGQRYGTNTDKWRWGQAHRARLGHPIIGRVPVLRELYRVEPATDGDNWTVNRGQSRLLDDGDPFGDVHGAGYRAVYDLADLDGSQFQMSLGQSGHRLSPHFSDLARPWADGTPFRIGRMPDQPEGTLTLRPR